MDVPDYMENELRFAALHRERTICVAFAAFIFSGFVLICAAITHVPSKPVDDLTGWSMIVCLISLALLCTMFLCPGNTLEEYRRFKKARLDELQKRLQNEVPGHTIVPVQIPHTEQKTH